MSARTTIPPSHLGNNFLYPVLDTMKASTLVLTLLSVADFAAAIKFVIGPPGWAQGLGFNVTEQPEEHQLKARQASGGGKTVLKNRLPNIPNAKSVKVRYGPFTVQGGGAYVS
jgi:hypothetical protein